MKFHAWAAITLVTLVAFAALYYVEAYRVDNLMGQLPPLRRPLAEVPMQLGPWSASARELSPEVERTLDAKEYISRTWTRPDTGEVLDLQFNYGHPRSIASHRPGVCFITQGWHQEFVRSTTLVIPQHTDQPDAENTLTLPVRFHGYRHPMGNHILVINYFNLGGAYVDNPDAVLDAAHSHATRKHFAAQIILYIPGNNQQQALQTAQDFLAHLHPEARACLPETKTEAP